MPKLPLKIAVVGCGAAFENLYIRPLQRLQRLGSVTVAALADPNVSRQLLGQKFFPRAKVGATLPEALGKKSVDLTIIMSPAALHLQHVRQALDAGSHVLCEKPMAESTVSARSMVESARQKNLLLAVGMTRRFYPCVRRAKQWIAEGRLGRILSYRYSEGILYRWPAASDAVFRRSSSGGGALFDKGSHALDLLVWLFGSACVQSHEDDAWMGGVEGLCRSVLNHDGNNGTVVLALNQELRNGFLIHGERGDLYLPVGPLHDMFHRSPSQPWTRVEMDVKFVAEVGGSVRKGFPRVYYECFDYQLIQVLRALYNGEPVPVTGEEALGTLTLIDEAYRIVKPLRQPWLPEPEQALANSRHWRARQSRTHVPLVT